MKHPLASFNQVNATPKTASSSPIRFHEWVFAQLIDISCEVGILKFDIKKFGHGLRAFRNYIHPNEHLASGFTPAEHTAKACFKFLRGPLVTLAGDRP